MTRESTGARHVASRRSEGLDHSSLRSRTDATEVPPGRLPDWATGRPGSRIQAVSDAVKLHVSGVTDVR